MTEYPAYIEATTGSERSFGWVFAIVFLIVGAWPLLALGSLRWWALAIALVLALVAELAPAWLSRPNRIWHRFGMLLGKVVSPVALLLVYVVAVVPVGLVMRLLGKDPLHRRIDRSRHSYWIERTDEPQSMKKQF